MIFSPEGRVWVCLWIEIQARGCSWLVLSLLELTSCAQLYALSKTPWSSPSKFKVQTDIMAILNLLSFSTYLRTEVTALYVHLEACWALEGGWVSAAIRDTNLIYNGSSHVLHSSAWWALFRLLRMRSTSFLFWYMVKLRSGESMW